MTQVFWSPPNHCHCLQCQVQKLTKVSANHLHWLQSQKDLDLVVDDYVALSSFLVLIFHSPPPHLHSSLGQEDGDLVGVSVLQPLKLLSLLTAAEFLLFLFNVWYLWIPLVQTGLKSWWTSSLITNSCWTSAANTRTFWTTLTLHWQLHHWYHYLRSWDQWWLLYRSSVS